MPIPSCIKRIGPALWEMPPTYKPGMRVPARFYGSEKIIQEMEPQVFDQAANVAFLPGILKYSLCMPDGHWGYGFPIGGVAAMNLDRGVISPGGIGYDINCGVRLIRTNLTYEEVAPRIKDLVDSLFYKIPVGPGRSGSVRLKKDEFRKFVEQGSKWCLNNGFASQEDLDRTEEGGCFEGADSSKVSERAIQRGVKQAGTLGSGNHYCEVVVSRPEDIFDQRLAQKFGFGNPNQIGILFHCGSRGFGHQVCDDYIRVMLRASQKYGISLPDRQLCCAPFRSPEGQEYFAAMKCAVNFAFANRQIIFHHIKEVFSDFFGRSPEDLGMRVVYDVCHNNAKIEKHNVDGLEKEVLVHRKGATRAFGPGMEGIPEIYKDTGQPVLLGGSMQTGSYVLAGLGTADASFYSTAHGSGRTMSRHAAKKLVRGSMLQREMEHQGIYVRSCSLAGLAEEAGIAYKDIDEVAESAELAGLSKRVLKLLPIGNIKG